MRGKLSVIGNGVVIDPWALIAEIKRVSELGVDVNSENLKIAENASFILPLHSELDLLREAAAGEKKKIGTTGRGIGPAYEDKVGRRAIRVSDLRNFDVLEQKIDRLLAHHNPLRRGLGEKEVDGKELFNILKEIAPKILKHATPVWKLLADAQKEGKRLLFEGAQGTMLDIDFGTYPFVTSSNTAAGQACSGSGVGPSSIDYVLGIVKAYTTRVGSGPFPTELFDETGNHLGEKGHEFGTVTGRQRRCGWLDAILVRQAVALSGINGIALTKLDVLDGLDEIKICTGYVLNGEKTDVFPTAMEDQAKVEPIYETMKGWQESTVGAKSIDDLPETAIKYIRRVEELIEAPVALLSTSPDRDDTALIHNPFA